MRPNMKDATAIPVRNDSASSYGWRNKAARALWGVAWILIFRPSWRRWHSLRRVILRAFGAQLSGTARVAGTATIWAPWNLVMEESAEIGPNVICYSVDEIRIGRHATVSQNSHLCAGGRDVSDRLFRPTKAPIVIEPYAWVGADAFVGPGVTIGEGAVLGARGVAFKDLPAWTISLGNPAQVVGRRILNDDGEAGSPRV